MRRHLEVQHPVDTGKDGGIVGTSNVGNYRPLRQTDKAESEIHTVSSGLAREMLLQLFKETVVALLSK